MSHPRISQFFSWMKESNPKAREITFDSIDVDGSGQIDSAELELLLARREPFYTKQEATTTGTSRFRLLRCVDDQVRMDGLVSLFHFLAL